MLSSKGTWIWTTTRENTMCRTWCWKWNKWLKSLWSRRISSWTRPRKSMGLNCLDWTFWLTNNLLRGCSKLTPIHALSFHPQSCNAWFPACWKTCFDWAWTHFSARMSLFHDTHPTFCTTMCSKRTNSSWFLTVCSTATSSGKRFASRARTWFTKMRMKSSTATESKSRL